VTTGTHVPYTEALTHAGAPWTTVTAHAVLGNLEGFTGVAEWGIATGADLTSLTGDYVVLSEGRAYFNQTIQMTTGTGIQHADGGTAGWVLVDDGTGFYSPGASAGGGIDLVATRGAIIYGDATPDWAVMAHPGAAFRHLETSALDFSWVADLQLDDGVGDSPTLTWQDGADDYAYMYLDSGVGEKTLIIDVDASGTASNPQLYIEMDGSLEFSFEPDLFRVWTDSAIMMADDSWIGLSAADGRITFDQQATDEIVVDDANLLIGAAVAIRYAGDITAQADIWLDGNAGISAEGSLYMLIDSDNNSTTAIFEVAKNADAREEAVSGTSIWYVAEDNKQVMRLAGVAHGATSIVNHTDAFFQVSNESSAGGTLITGAKDSGGDAGAALALRGLLDENADTTRSTAGRAIVEVYSGQESGGTWGDVGANGNVFNVRARRSSAWATVFIVDEDGDLWLPGKIDASDAGIQTQVSTANVTDIEPTDAELDATFGTAATVGAGFIGIVDDAGAHVRVWLVTSDGTNWWKIQLSIAP